MLRYISFLLLFFTLNGAAQELTLKKGIVVDSLKVNDSISETFSLFLPKSYSNDTIWPVVFVFEPQGRGKSAAQLFSHGAEEQGYIIIASNNIVAKDSLLKNLEVANRMMITAFNFFPLDQNRIYTAGYAEGAEVASAIPAVVSNVQGVMAAGGSWLNRDLLKKVNRFSFIGISGYNDFRIYNLEEAVEFFRRNNHPASLYTFNGFHEWPGTQLISRALGSFTLQAIERGFKPGNPELVESLYQAELEEAERLRRTMQFYKSYEMLEFMEDKYALYNKKDELKSLQKELRRNTLYRQQKKEYNNALVLENWKKEEYSYYFEEDVALANFENIPWWSQQLVELKKYQDGKNMAEAEMAYRLQGFLASLTSSYYASLSQAGASIDPLIFTAVLQTIFDKQNPEGYKNIISLSARDGDYEMAMLYLEDLLKTGYKEMEALYDIPGTLDLKLSPEYNSLIKKYLGESKFYDL
ncbi:hypothetical protein ACKGJN_09310 [Gillisia sp. Q332]|uniref:hypothetical protein n=1 Tax=Gillisia xinjiangensis TaxID=3384765 RepID=UPI00391A7532